MTDSSCSKMLLNCDEETLQLTKELERMVDAMDNMSAQLSWMAYDMVVLRTDPEHAQTLQQLEKAHALCQAAIHGQQSTPSTSKPTQ